MVYHLIELAVVEVLVRVVRFEPLYRLFDRLLLTQPTIILPLHVNEPDLLLERTGAVVAALRPRVVVVVMHLDGRRLQLLGDVDPNALPLRERELIEGAEEVVGRTALRFIETTQEIREKGLKTLGLQLINH